MDSKEERCRLTKNERGRLLRYLVRGGPLKREEVGGVIKVRYHRPSRSGEGYSRRLVERLIFNGFKLDGDTYTVNEEDDGMVRATVVVTYTPPETEPLTESQN